MGYTRSRRDTTISRGDPEEIQIEAGWIDPQEKRYKEICGKYREIRLKDTRGSVQDIGRSVEDIETSGIRYLQEIWRDLWKYKEIWEMT
jgi:hypothetical protein